MSRVRPATLADVAGIAAAHVAIWRETYTGVMPEDVLAGWTTERSADIWRRALSAPADDAAWCRRIVVAEVDGEVVVGFAAAGPPRELPAPTAVQLYAINLLRAHHGSGLGQQLLDAVIGDRPAFLWVAEQNPRAAAFYARNGFARDGVVTDDEALRIREVRMVRTPRPSVAGGLGAAPGPAYP